MTTISVRTFRRSVAIVILLAIGLIAWQGSEKRPARPVAGDGFNGPAAGEVIGAFRVGSFNIWGGKGLDKVQDLQRTADEIAGLHLVGLQEVEGPMLWRRGNNAEQLSEKLGLAWAYAPTEQRWWSDHFGNGMLSDMPIVHWQSIPLPGTQRRGHRNVVLTRIEHEGQIISVLNTHIDRRQDRHPQLRAIVELFLALEEPAILMGDLNSPAEDVYISRLIERPDVLDAVGEAMGENAPPRIDWIFVRGLRVLDGGVGEVHASDHPLVWAELELAR